ncbi:DNA-binding transcriptional regulator Nlp [compost metagenome]
MNKTEIPHDPAQRWEWIKWQLRRRNTSLADLARELDVSRNAMNNVKRQAYPRMERAIAKALELQPVEIWPERWNSDNTPTRARPGRAESMTAYMQKHNATPDLEHVKAVAVRGDCHA